MYERLKDDLAHVRKKYSKNELENIEMQSKIETLTEEMRVVTEERDAANNQIKELVEAAESLEQ